MEKPTCSAARVGDWFVVPIINVKQNTNSWKNSLWHLCFEK
jgi:hypothetical protein